MNTLFVRPALMLPSWTRVCALLFIGRPAAVFRRVVALVVDAFNRRALEERWFHVLPEIFEVAPACADLNASRAVSFEVDLFGIATAIKHRSPSTMEKMLADTRRVPMRAAKIRHELTTPFSQLLRIHAHTISIYRCRKV